MDESTRTTGSRGEVRNLDGKRRATRFVQNFICHHHGKGRIREREREGQASWEDHQKLTTEEG